MVENKGKLILTGILIPIIHRNELYTSESVSNSLVNFVKAIEEANFWSLPRLQSVLVEQVVKWISDIRDLMDVSEVLIKLGKYDMVLSRHLLQEEGVK